MKVECLCINAKNKPSDVPLNMWISEGIEYTINHVYYYPKQGIQGVLIDEVQIKNCKHDSYRIDRFAFTEKGLKDLKELMSLCTELNDVDISKLLEELQLETIE